MPTYTFYSHDTDEVFEISMKMSEREDYIENNNVTQIPTPVALHSGRGMTKPDEGFRDILREMKKRNSKGLYRSTINTF